MKIIFMKLICFLGLRPLRYKRIFLLSMPIAILGLLLVYEVLISTFYILGIMQVVSSTNKIDLKHCLIENQYPCIKKEMSHILFHSQTGGLLFLTKAVGAIGKNTKVTKEQNLKDLINIVLDVVEHTDLKNSILNNVITLTPIGRSQVCLLKKIEKDQSKRLYSIMETKLNKKIKDFESKNDSSLDLKQLKGHFELVLKTARNNNEIFLSKTEKESCKESVKFLDNRIRENDEKDKFGHWMNEDQI